ncbi:metal ABC transporter permease [Leucobacter chromiireducens]|uniref:Metal ABC transporter permease n=1 Tax=Leucobacter chromiireducens subsp. chromiireducens TaxID=660067 RepID=A0ABS1SK02_9MICO|nr:metal ABC transporter permease [Leucobacter chromiireducens]MBL3688500.1 metal ABC transporter permease [Leucobacter chromiireducens subsp. chromiireducens]
MSYFALAALELTLLGLLAGLAGALIVLRRRSFFAVALSHATFPGGVVFAIAGWNLLLGQALFALVLVLLMTLLGRLPGQGRQVTSGVVLSFGFALGTLLTSLNPGLGIPVEALLVGSPLSVSVGDVIATAAVLVAVAAVLALTGRRILFHTFDPVGFTAAGFRAWPIELAVTGVIAAAVVVAMPAVGAILGVAVLIGPAAAARALTDRIGWIPPLAALIGVAGGLAGLWVSRELGIAAGGAVGLAITALFLVAVLVRSVRAAAASRRERAKRTDHAGEKFATVGA